MDKQNIVNALGILYPNTYRYSKHLTSEQENDLKKAMATVLLYMGSQEQYHDYKDNYLQFFN